MNPVIDYVQSNILHHLVMVGSLKIICPHNMRSYYRVLWYPLHAVLHINGVVVCIHIRQILYTHLMTSIHTVQLKGNLTAAHMYGFNLTAAHMYG